MGVVGRTDPADLERADRASEPVSHARVAVTVHDGDVVFGIKAAHDGPLPAGPSPLRQHPRAPFAQCMSRVEERRSAKCTLTIEEMYKRQGAGSMDEAVDVLPRDLCLWTGDPRRRISLSDSKTSRRARQLLAARRVPMLRRAPESSAILNRLVNEGLHLSFRLSRSLLAPLSGPTTPRSRDRREAADDLGAATGNPSFSAFQTRHRRGRATSRREHRRDLSGTSAPADRLLRAPTRLGLQREGQRIRDHGDVARGGLGTCMDTTVLPPP